jgi:Endonuclease NucS
MYEQDFENILARYPELIEIGLSLEGRQVSIKGKYIDLLFKDKHGGRLIVELKRGTVLRKDIGQLMDYEGELLFPDDPTVRVMLIGNRIPPSFGRSLDHHGLEWREFPIAHLIEFLRQKNDNEFLQYFSNEEAQQATVTKPIKELKPQRIKTLNSASSEIFDKVRKVFHPDYLGEALTRKQIIDMIEAAYPRTNRSSVIPSDYCYNIVNNGIAFKFHYFEYLRDARHGEPQYKVLGEDCDYEGAIYWKKEIVGEWLKGETEPRKGERWPSKSR